MEEEKRRSQKKDLRAQILFIMNLRIFLFVTRPVGVARLGQLTATVGGIVGKLRVGGDDDVGGGYAMQAPSGGDILLFHRMISIYILNINDR